MSEYELLEDKRQIVDRMNAIRNVGEQGVREMHHEAMRMTDWREYVRAHPVAAVAAAATLGYTIFGQASTAVRQDKPAADSDRSPSPVSTTLASGAMAFLGSMASQAAKHYVSGYVRNQLTGANRDSAERPEPFGR